MLTPCIREELASRENRRQGVRLTCERWCEIVEGTIVVSRFLTPAGASPPDADWRTRSGSSILYDWAPRQAHAAVHDMPKQA